MPRWRYSPTPATSCPATQSAWPRPSPASSPTREPDRSRRMASLEHSPGSGRHTGPPTATTPRVRRSVARRHIYPRDPPDGPGRTGCAADVTPLLAVRPLRRVCDDAGFRNAAPAILAWWSSPSGRSRTAARATTRWRAPRSGDDRSMAERGEPIGDTPWVGRSVLRVEDDALLRGKAVPRCSYCSPIRGMQLSFAHNSPMRGSTSTPQRRSNRRASWACSRGQTSRGSRGPSRQGSSPVRLSGRQPATPPPRRHRPAGRGRLSPEDLATSPRNNARRAVEVEYDPLAPALIRWPSPTVHVIGRSRVARDHVRHGQAHRRAPVLHVPRFTCTPVECFVVVADSEAAEVGLPPAPISRGLSPCTALPLQRSG